jgi:hypothetical protein
MVPHRSSILLDEISLDLLAYALVQRPNISFVLLDKMSLVLLAYVLVHCLNYFAASTHESVHQGYQSIWIHHAACQVYLTCPSLCHFQWPLNSWFWHSPTLTIIDILINTTPSTRWKGCWWWRDTSTISTFERRSDTICHGARHCVPLEHPIPLKNSSHCSTSTSSRVVHDHQPICIA